jgi:hypothetical protein
MGSGRDRRRVRGGVRRRRGTTPTPTPGATPLRVVTWNLYLGADFTALLSPDFDRADSRWAHDFRVNPT